MNICFYHNDTDGRMSAAIVMKHEEKIIYKELTDFKEMKYGFNEDEFVDTYSEQKFNKVYVVDFSFPEHIFKMLLDNCKELIWCDHHESAFKRLPKWWDGSISPKLKGQRSIAKAGCRLTWEYLFEKRPIPKCVIYAEDNDLWKFNHSWVTKAFAEKINTEPNIFIHRQLLDETNLMPLISEGKILLTAMRQRVEKTFSGGHEITFHRHKAYVVNTNHDISSMGEYIYKEKEYPIAIIWFFREGKFRVSLRSDTVAVDKIAEQYGGGGHEFASGFELLPQDKEVLNILGVK